MATDDAHAISVVGQAPPAKLVTAVQLHHAIREGALVALLGKWHVVATVRGGGGVGEQKMCLLVLLQHLYSVFSVLGGVWGPVICGKLVPYPDGDSRHHDQSTDGVVAQFQELKGPAPI